MDNETTDLGGMLEALDEILQRFYKGGPDTKDRLAPILIERTRAAERESGEKEKALKDVSRSIWGALMRISKTMSDENIDRIIQNYVDGKRRKK